MDGERFDGIVRRLTTNASRRGLLGGVIASAVGLTGAGLAANDVSAKKGGNGKSKGKGHGKGKGKKGKGKGQEKVTLCHNGHTITVGAPAVPAHQAHGDTLGPCPCEGVQEGGACTIPETTTAGVCCSGTCTELGTLQNCASCGDVCPETTDICDDLNSGGDPESGCCAPLDATCDPVTVPDRCCGTLTCVGGTCA